MKITSERKLESSTKEILKIEIEWDPGSDREDGLVAYVWASVDMVKTINSLEKIVSETDGG